MESIELEPGKVIGGTFTLYDAYKNVITEPIPFDATVEQINAAVKRAGSSIVIESSPPDADSC